MRSLRGRCIGPSRESATAVDLAEADNAPTSTADAAAGKRRRHIPA
jgi:hypothetical protein